LKKREVKKKRRAVKREEKKFGKKASGNASLGGGIPALVPITVLTPAIGGRKDSPTTRLRRILQQNLVRAQADFENSKIP
jgi:hypothetical protein